MARNAPRASWAVATIARESPDVIRRFVSWHLDMGAAEVTIYFDDPDDANIDMVAHIPQVKSIRCTPEFWTGVGMSPDRMFIKRQNRAMQHAYNNCPYDWLLVCDADELLYLKDEILGEFLAEQTEATRSVTFRPAERVVVDGEESETYYRLPMPRNLLARYMGPELAGALMQRGGFVGHSVGKSILRPGIPDILIRQHFGQLPGYVKVLDEIIDWQSGGAILHLMNNSFADWNRKLRVRIGGSSMTRGLSDVLRKVFDAGDEEAIEAYFRKLYHVSPEMAYVLKRRGVLVQADVTPDHAVARYFPDVRQ
ncbi:MAG: glycosyltransferase family 2 protein [Deltaproteobacteria bacterium]